MTYYLRHAEWRRNLKRFGVMQPYTEVFRVTLNTLRENRVVVNTLLV